LRSIHNDIVEIDSWMLYFVVFLSTNACLFMFYSTLSYYVFVCNLTAVCLYVTTRQCKWPFVPFAVNTNNKKQLN